MPALPGGKIAKQVVSGDEHTLILTEDGTVFVCGNNCLGQLGLGDSHDRITFTALRTIPQQSEKLICAGSQSTIIYASLRHEQMQAFEEQTTGLLPGALQGVIGTYVQGQGK